MFSNAIISWINLNIWVGRQFKCEEVSAEFDGKVYNFKFQYRDPWDYISSLVNDESLMSVHMWNSVKKYYCEGDFEEQIFDEPNTAETWWNVDVSLYSSNFLSIIKLETNRPVQSLVWASWARSLSALLCTTSLLVRQRHGNTTCQKISNGHSSSLVAA